LNRKRKCFHLGSTSIRWGNCHTYRREVAENGPLHVQDQRQSVRLVAAAALKFTRIEVSAADPPSEEKALPAGRRQALFVEHPDPPRPAARRNRRSSVGDHRPALR
jgi:hypothetical protein